MGRSNYVKIDLPKIENLCFVLMPFAEEFEDLYENVIKKTVTGLKMDCLRADEIYKPNVIVKDIWDSIRKAKFVIADISTKNPNVLYELGLAYALGKQVIIINRDKSGVPFDVNLIKYINYDTNDPFWGQKLSENLRSYINACNTTPFEYCGIFDGIFIKIYESYQQVIDINAFTGCWTGNTIGEFRNYCIYHLNINPKANQFINFLVLNENEVVGKTYFNLEVKEAYFKLSETKNEAGERFFDYFDDWDPDIFLLQQNNELLIGKNETDHTILVFRRETESEFAKIKDSFIPLKPKK